MAIKETCEGILKYIGGEENITNVYHCATRLRFTVKNPENVDLERMEKVDKVLGTMHQGDTYQIVLGPGADQYYHQFIQLGNFAALGEVPEETEKAPLTVKNIFIGFVNAIAGCFNPILPAVIGCAMLKIVALLLDMTGIMPAGSSTYTVLSFAADSAFYFMPFLLAASAAKKFNANTYLAIAVCGFLFYPSFVDAVSSGTALNFFGLPIGLVGYSGTLFPIVAIVWIESFIEKFLDKHLPDVIKYLMKPLITLLVMIPVAYVVVGPIATYFANGLAALFNLISAKIGFVFTAFLAGVLPFLVPVGLHSGIVPLILNNQAAYGFDSTFFPSYLAFHLALAGSGLAVALKSRNKETKNVAFMGSLTTLLGGITEPLLFGVHLRLRKPYIGAVIGAVVAGAYAGIVKLAAYAFAFPCLTSILMWKEPNGSANLINAVITVVIALVVGFAATWFVGIGNEEE